MNINTVQNNTVQTQSGQKTTSQDNSVKFSDELKNLSQTKSENNTKTVDSKPENKAEENSKDNPEENTKDSTKNAIDGLEGAVEEISKLNRTDENEEKSLKVKALSDDIKNKNEEFGLIDNNMNIQEPKDRLNAEMNANMSFNSNGQPFSEFINPENSKQELKVSARDIAEEKAILSTMEENIAIANKNMAMKDTEKTKTVTNEEVIRKVSTDTNITVDTIAKFDSVIMDKSDVEFFANLVNGDVMNLSDVKNPEKSASVSKTLADLLAKSMEENKPVRIDFDNNISVIIKISRDGKISADFLPSSQVAEAYLKENLPLLKQRFDDNNIDYEQLNQRKQQNQNNRKKGRKDE